MSVLSSRRLFGLKVDFSNGPDTPWVSGHPRPMHYFRDLVSLYPSLTKSGLYLEWNG